SERIRTPSIIPVDQGERLLSSVSDELILLFTGDTQYHFPCTLNNGPCKERSRECRERNGLKYNLHKRNSTGLTRAQVQAHEQECIRIEGDFANEVQRKSIFDLNRKLANKPKGLIINGDLTDFGHAYQLNLFNTEWLTLPIPVYVGLGNHDYENNVDDCVANQCANNMLYWFTRQYAKEKNLILDVTRSTLVWKTTYKGSLAYSKDICSHNNTNCVHVVQLHNRPDYAVAISSASHWQIHGSFQWLLADMEAAKNHTWPILINLHNHNGNVARRLKTTLGAVVTMAGRPSCPNPF
ncbi:Protein C41G11.1 a, partial [Aphelenchoides avenae]